MKSAQTVAMLLTATQAAKIESSRAIDEVS
jgi:hypothetical protein